MMHWQFSNVHALTRGFPALKTGRQLPESVQKDKQNREARQIVHRYLALVRSLPRVQLPKHSYFPYAAQSVANSKKNTDLNQGETPMERLWAGIGQHPRGPRQQGHTPVVPLSRPGPKASARAKQDCYWTYCCLPSLPYFPGAAQTAA